MALFAEVAPRFVRSQERILWEILRDVFTGWILFSALKANYSEFFYFVL